MRPCHHGRACKEPPTVLGPPNSATQYRVLHLIGKGGFARVYTVRQTTPQLAAPSPRPTPSRRGEHGSLNHAPNSTPTNVTTQNPSTHPVLALKVISKCRLANTATGREALRNEVSIHRQLQHPAIVRLISYWEDQYRIYLLMNYVNGPQLEQYVKSRGRLTEEEASTYAANIFEALSYLHANRIIHRDLKLANILLFQDLNRVLLCDFGLAAHLDSLRPGKDSNVCGTPNYVAPELLTPSALARLTPKRSYGQSHKPFNSKQAKRAGATEVSYTTSADSWSMGVVLYTMLVGSGPFDGEDIKRTFNKIRTARFTFPIGLRLSANAKSLIRLLLSEDQTKRPSADQALSHPFFTTRPIPKLFPQSSNLGLIPEGGYVEHARDADPRQKTRDHFVDRADGPGEHSSVRSRRKGFTNRRGSDLQRWNEAYSANNPNLASSSKDAFEVGRPQSQGSSRYARQHSHDFGSRRLPRAAKERSSSLTTSAVVQRSRNHTRRSSLNTRAVNELKESRQSQSFRRSSIRFSEKRTDLLNLSVTLSAALMWGRQCLDDSLGHESEEDRRQKLALVAQAVTLSDTPPLVRRWADYTRKHGFATMMEDGRTGICFNDGSIMFFVSVTESSEIPEFAYIPPLEAQSDSGSSDSSDGDAQEKRSKDISKKACLCNLFADLMHDGGRGSMYDLPSACNVSFLKPDSETTDQPTRTPSREHHKDVVHVRDWARFRNSRAVAFRLSNYSIHVKFDVGEDRCDDFLFNLVSNTLFYREARTGEAWECDVKNLGEFSTISEHLHAQLELCSQAISQMLK